MGVLDDIMQWGREKSAGLGMYIAREYPETGDYLMRVTGQGDKLDMVKFLYQVEPGLDAKIEDAKKDPMFAKIYDTILASTEAEIQKQIDDIPPEWIEAAKNENVPVNELVERIRINGAKKITFAVASSVRSETENMAWYTGRIAGDVYDEAKEKVWKSPEKSFSEDPVNWVGTMISNVIHLIGELFSADPDKLKQRGMQYVATDTAERADEIVTKTGETLAFERGMPLTFTVQTMASIYEQLKKQADPNFHMSDEQKADLMVSYYERLGMKSNSNFRLNDAQKADLKAQFMTKLQDAAALNTRALQRQQQQEEHAQPPKASTPPSPGYSGAEMAALPGIATDEQAAAATAAEAAPPPPPVTAQPLQYKPGEAPADYPYFVNADLSKYRSDPGLLGHLDMGSLGLTLSLIGANSDERRMQVIKSYLPDAVFYRDERNDALIVEIDGDRFYWNAPGFGVDDLSDMTMLGLKWAPVGKVTKFVAPAKTMAGKALAYVGVGTALSAAEDSLASFVAGQPDLDVGNAVIDGLKGAAGAAGVRAFSVLKSVSVSAVGAIAKKVASGGIMTSSERALLREAGVDPKTVTHVLDDWLAAAREKAAQTAAKETAEAAAKTGGRETTEAAAKAAGNQGAKTAAQATTAGGTVLAPLAAAAGEPVPHEDVDPTAPIKPGKTPNTAPSEGYDMSFPLIP